MNTSFGAPRRALHRITAVAAAALAALGLTLASAAPALAHDELVGVQSALSDDGTRMLITLQFNNEIMQIGSESVATGADGADLTDGAPVVSGREVRQSVIVPPTEQTGALNWRVVSSDGHPIEGSLAIIFAGEDSAVSIADPRFTEETDESTAPDHEHADDADEHGDHEHEAEVTAEKNGSGASIWVWIAIAVAIGASATAGAIAVKRKQQRTQAGEEGAE